MSDRNRSGFTLSELLIALGVLGLIASFTIPKVLQSVGNAQKKAIAKEAAAILSQAYEAYGLDNEPGAGFNTVLLKPYINHAEDVDAGLLDSAPSNGGMTTLGCAWAECIRLHNGAVLFLWGGGAFDGTDPETFATFLVDVDGANTGVQDSIWMNVYYDGAIRSDESMKPGSHNTEMATGPIADGDPDWFSWD